MQAGDMDLALFAAERIVEEARPSRERVLAALVAGMIYREKKLHNLASERFALVRRADAPLSEWAAYFEAEQDLSRGKPGSTLKACDEIQSRYPDGHFLVACTRLRARALVATGRTNEARDLAKRHDAEHDGNQIAEQIDLAIGRRWAKKNPELAIPLLKRLVVEHSAPLTGRVAEQVLGELRASGHETAVVPEDTASVQRRAVSLREVKRKAEAWGLFAEVERRAAAGDRAAAAWVDAERERFAWRTHQWGELVRLYEKINAEKATAQSTWNYYKALDRGGRYQEALAVAVAGLKEWPSKAPWRRSEEVVSRTALLARDYTVARRLLDTVADRGGWAGRRARVTAGFAATMAGDHEDAILRLTEVVDESRGYEDNSRYWRARAFDLAGRTEDANADRVWILENDPMEWYASLLRTADHANQGPPWDRTGRWPGPEAPVQAVSPPPLALPAEVPVSAWVTPRRVVPDLTPWASLVWPLQPPPPPEPFESALVDFTVPSWALQDPLSPPASYRPALWSEAEALRDLEKASSTLGDGWREWQVVRDLAEGGLYDHAGPLMSEIHEEYREAKKSSRHPRYRSAVTFDTLDISWRGLFLVSRDHHHTDRWFYGSWNATDQEETRREALRLGHPLAHDRYVWQHAREHDVDPYLVMAIMRIESRYDSIALSPVGARGAMQIMPRTGALLADRQGDEEFLTGDLEDPIRSVGYGIDYLGLLLDRFDGAFPLAVASYNGGPFNVSSWMLGLGDLPMDAWVEHIPFRETRNYVKKVGGAYQSYLDIYEPAGTRMVLPAAPYRDDPGVVDF
jgi:soluble lytic murein transglycosylase